MILKLRMNQRTKENIADYKTKYFAPTDRVSSGYIIALAVNNIDKLTHEMISSSFNICMGKGDEHPAVSTSLTIRQSAYEKLLQFQCRLEKLSDKKMYMSQVIDILMAAVNFEKYSDKHHHQILQLTKKMATNGIDAIAFKREYELSDYANKKILYEVVRDYLENKDPDLCATLRQQIAEDIRKYFNYYNINQYFQPRKKTYGTANIVYIAKAVAGLILTIAEIENYDMDEVLEEMKQNVKEQVK